MKTLFTLALILLSFSVQAQRLLGYTQSEVLEHQKKNVNTSAPEFGVNDEGTPFIAYNASKSDGFTIVYYFNANRCYSVAFISYRNYKSFLLENMMKNGFYYEDGYWYNEEDQEIGTFTDNEEDGLCIFEVRHWK